MPRAVQLCGPRPPQPITVRVSLVSGPNRYRLDAKSADAGHLKILSSVVVGSLERLEVELRGSIADILAARVLLSVERMVSRP